jgi:hypothetical protein
MAEAGLKATGKSPNGMLCETIELDDHPWFFGCQFHPEYKSRPTRPHPVFVHFVRAALEYRRSKDQLLEQLDSAADSELGGAILQTPPGGVSPES